VHGRLAGAAPGAVAVEQRLAEAQSGWRPSSLVSRTRSPD